MLTAVAMMHKCFC